MYHLHVRVLFDALPERVFQEISDHEKFLSGPTSTCQLTREGREDRHGLGAVRAVQAGKLHFTEEIVLFEPPCRFDYIVSRMVGAGNRPLPIKHERGWMIVEQTADGTAVDWHSRFRVTVPLIGWIMERFVGARTAPLFKGMLLRLRDRMKAEAETSSSTTELRHE